MNLAAKSMRYLMLVCLLGTSIHAVYVTKPRKQETRKLLSTADRDSSPLVIPFGAFYVEDDWYPTVSFKANMYGHAPAYLEVIREAAVKNDNFVIYLAGDSSFDNKVWAKCKGDGYAEADRAQPPLQAVQNAGFAELITMQNVPQAIKQKPHLVLLPKSIHEETASKMVPDVAYWMNQVGWDLGRRDFVCMNAAVESANLGNSGRRGETNVVGGDKTFDVGKFYSSEHRGSPRSQKIYNPECRGYPQDRYIQEHIHPEDVLVISIGFNDIHQDERYHPILHDAIVQHATGAIPAVREHAGIQRVVQEIFVDDYSAYVRWLTQSTKPRIIMFSTLYYPNGENMGYPAEFVQQFVDLSAEAADRVKEELEKLPEFEQVTFRVVRQTKTLRRESPFSVETKAPTSTSWEPAIDCQMDVVASVEPSANGGRKMAKNIWEELIRLL